jgi:hypothetical protein
MEGLAAIGDLAPRIRLERSTSSQADMHPLVVRAREQV